MAYGKYQNVVGTMKARTAGERSHSAVHTYCCNLLPQKHHSSEEQRHRVDQL